MRNTELNLFSLHSPKGHHQSLVPPSLQVISWGQLPRERQIILRTSQTVSGVRINLPCNKSVGQRDVATNTFRCAKCALQRVPKMNAEAHCSCTLRKRFCKAGNPRFWLVSGWLRDRRQQGRTSCPAWVNLEYYAFS